MGTGDILMWGGLAVAIMSEVLAFIPGLKSNSVVMLVYSIIVTLFSGVKNKEI